MSFGTQTFNDETYESSGFQINSIDPVVASRAGGTKITLTGIFPTQQTYAITVDGVTAYGGVAGQGNVIETTDGDTLSFVVPPLLLSQIGSVVVLVDKGGDTRQINLEISEKNFGFIQFEARRMFPPTVEVGPRRLELEPQEQ
jgi:hypothetical protein